MLVENWVEYVSDVLETQLSAHGDGLVDWPQHSPGHPDMRYIVLTGGMEKVTTFIKGYHLGNRVDKLLPAVWVSSKHPLSSLTKGLFGEDCRATMYVNGEMFEVIVRDNVPANCILLGITKGDTDAKVSRQNAVK